MENAKYFITPNGEKLLTEWSYSEYSKLYKKAERAARELLPSLELLHGEREKTAAETFGLPYTSSGDFAAVWNCNTEARLRGTRLYFNGIAINADGQPIEVYTEYNADGDEVRTVYTIHGLKARASLYAYGEK